MDRCNCVQLIERTSYIDLWKSGMIISSLFCLRLFRNWWRTSNKEKKPTLRSGFNSLPYFFLAVSHFLCSSFQAACTILSIDETIKNAKSNPEPQNQMPAPAMGRRRGEWRKLSVGRPSWVMFIVNCEIIRIVWSAMKQRMWRFWVLIITTSTKYWERMRASIMFWWTDFVDQFVCIDGNGLTQGRSYTIENYDQEIIFLSERELWWRNCISTWENYDQEVRASATTSNNIRRVIHLQRCSGCRQTRRSMEHTQS